MTAMDRRLFLRAILPGAAVAAIGVTAVASIGLSLVPDSAEAFPVDKLTSRETTNLLEDAQVVVVPGRRRVRRRRWVCWWRGGRRVCGWRWRWVWI